MKFVENELDVKTYLELRASVHWKVLLEEQAELALKNSLYTLVVYDGSGDGAHCRRWCGDLLCAGSGDPSGVPQKRNRRGVAGSVESVCGRAADPRF